MISLNYKSTVSSRSFVMSQLRNYHACLNYCIIIIITCIYHTVLSQFFIYIRLYICQSLYYRETLRLRVVRGSGHFPTVSGPVCVNELPFLAEQFVRMSAEVISLCL